MAREAFLSRGSPECGVRGWKCSNRDCESRVEGGDHIHITPVGNKNPYGACSEECAMAIVQQYELEIVEASDA